MNILEAILSAQGGDLGRMASRFDLDQGQAQTAIEALLPMLAGAVSRNAQQPGGLEGLLGALADGHHQRYLDDPAMLEDERTLQDGNAILGHLFGDKEVSRQVAVRASAQTGIGADVLRQMLPLLAAMLKGGLLGGGQQPGHGPQAQSGGGLMELLTPMLDRNRDGSAMDDILGMAAQFLQRR
jgi:hypothetical protein